MDDIIKEMNDNFVDEINNKKFVDETNNIKGISNDIKDKYLNNIINKPNLEDIEDEKDDIQEAVLEVKPVDPININTVTEYCQYKDCYKKSSKKGKYKFLCSKDQKEGQKLININNPDIVNISEDMAAKSLLAFQQQLYMISEFMVKTFSKNQLEGLTRKAMENKEDLLQIHKDIIKMYGVESIEYIANPLAILALTTGSHILTTYVENSMKNDDILI